MRLSALLLAAPLVLSSCASADSWQTNEHTPPAKARNVVLFIGDGMGPAVVSAAAFVDKGAKLENGEPPKLFFETFPVYGVATTFSANSLVTDSAASATSLASGVKTNNGAIGVDANGADVETIAEFAHSKGMATGVVTSVGLNHATPSAFYAHQSSRGSYRDLLDDYFANSVPDVLFGGGIHNSPEIEQYAAQKAAKNGILYYTADTRDQIDPAKAVGKKVMGNFSKNDNYHLDFMALPDRAGEPELSDIAIDALKILKATEKPFFLIVEGGAIDWGSHSNQGDNAVGEVIEFDDTIEKTVEFLKSNDQLDQTLIIVTADHETGGLAINGPYKATLDEKPIQYAWTSTNHTAISVPVYAMGPGAEKLAGKVDQTQIHRVMKEALE